MESYEKLKEIGKGSYGVVWLVKNKKDKKNYVMKQIDLRKTSDKDIQSAQQEAKLLSKLKHPNIVAYRDSFQTNGFLYIVMVYCEGGDLYTKIKEQNSRYLEETQVVEWFVQIAMALQYMHERHILHRDLKTQNIFLTKTKIVKVGDLGIARVLKGNNDMATTVIGTPYYMSPELFSNKPYNSKSDVWALGCCVYEMATLKHAFNAKDMNSLVYKIVRGKMPAVPNIYSKELIVLIESMLNADPKKRPSVNKILRDPYIRTNINLFLERTKQRQKQTNIETKVNDSAQNSPQNLRPQRYSSPNILIPQQPPQSAQSELQQSPKVNDHQSSRRSSISSANLINSDSESEYKQRKPQQQNVKKVSPSSSPSEMMKNSSPRVQLVSPPPIGWNTPIDIQELAQQAPPPPLPPQPIQRQRRSVRISSVVNNIETQEAIEINDHSFVNDEFKDNSEIKFQMRKRALNNNNNGNSSNQVNSVQHKSSSNSSSIESIENKEHLATPNVDIQTPKIINGRPSNSSNSPLIFSPNSEKSDTPSSRQSTDSGVELPGKVNQSARERRRLKLKLTAQSDNGSIESKPPILRKVEKFSRPSSGLHEVVDGILPRPKSASVVSKSHNDINVNEHHQQQQQNQDFPFKDSLRMYRNNNYNNQQQQHQQQQQQQGNRNIRHEAHDAGKVIHSKSMSDVHQNKAPLKIIQNKIDSKINKLVGKVSKFTCDSSSSSSELDEENDPEKAKLKQQEKDEKEMNNLVTLLNTTLHALNNFKADSEIDEFEEPLDDYELDQIDAKPIPLTRASTNNTNNNTNDDDDESFIRQQQKAKFNNNNNKRNDDLEQLKVLENLNNVTLGATKRMQDRISVLEKDCIDAIGETKFQKAYEILEHCRDDEHEPRLLELLGRDDFVDYAGKIWQLKFFKDSERFSRR